MIDPFRAARAACAALFLSACAAAAQTDPGPVFHKPAAPDTALVLTAEDSAALIAEIEAEERAASRPARAARAGKRARFKSDIWLPLPSMFLPGFGQYFHGDGTGGIYTGIAAAGYVIAFQAMIESIGEAVETTLDEDPTTRWTEESWSYRRFMLGSMAAQGSGFMSAYSAFRSSVPRFQEEDGKYLFLNQKETVGDVLASPFHFGHLLKPATFVPLAILGGGVVWLVGEERSSHRGADWTMSPDDFPFYGALAWNAGTTEEALFRGWLLPVGNQYIGNFWVANSAQALLFGAVHYSEANPIPWPQTLLGFYFGWQTRRNDWTLGEAAFLHAWWDAIIFAGLIVANRDEPDATARFRFDLPIGW